MKFDKSAKDLTRQTHLRQLYTLLGLLVFASGIAYYTIYRTYLPWPGYLFNVSWVQFPELIDISLGSYPSFAFCLSFGFWAIALFTPNTRATLLTIVGVLSIGLILESAVGTFDRLDILSALLGAMIAGMCAITCASLTSRNAMPSNEKAAAWSQKSKHFTIFTLATVFATGSHVTGHHFGDDCVRYDENGICIEEAIEARPVYLSYSDLRSSVKTEDVRELSSVSRIYLYKNYLFINERNEGIHVIDNTVPTSPKQISFIAIPGNTELSIRSDNLYADSYIDLVTLDVSDINNIREVSREESIFPYDALQNIPNNVRINESIDSTRGVVIGYR